MFRRQKTSKSLGIKLYNTFAIPALIYGSENCTTKARDARRITAAEMKYMRKTAGSTWTEYKTITEIAKELNIISFLDKIQEYIRNYLQHTNITKDNKKLQTKMQKEPGATTEETSGSVGPEQVNKWPDFVLLRWSWWLKQHYLSTWIGCLQRDTATAHVATWCLYSYLVNCKTCCIGYSRYYTCG